MRASAAAVDRTMSQNVLGRMNGRDGRVGAHIFGEHSALLDVPKSRLKDDAHPAHLDEGDGFA